MNNDEYIKTENRIKDGSINEQSIWSCVKERNSYSVDSLLRTALIDCTREYTYRQMFALWDKYAGVFSALGMTEENGSRVGIAGTISAEPLFAFYGLNMTGVCVSMLSYPDFLPSGQWKKMVEREKLTDLLLSDIMISPEMWPDILAAKEKFGIRNIILLHSKLGGPCAGPAELIYNEVNYHRIKGLSGVVYMDDLLRRYDHFPVQYGSGNPDKIAVITHTSGSTKGIRKPLPYAERSVNVTAYNMGPNIHALGGDKEGKMQYRYIPSFDFSSFLCMCGVINSGLAASECVVLTFFGFMHPKFIRAVKYYNIDVMLVSGFMVDNWIKKEDDEDIDLSSVKIFSCGGSYISVDRLKRYYEFVRKHGYDGDIMRGYGMSETGGAELMVPMGCMDDILGFPTPKENFLVRDMEDDNYYTADDGVRTGTMYVASDSLCTNELDGEVLFEYTVINGRNYLCSNDLVRVNEDGSFSYFLQEGECDASLLVAGSPPTAVTSLAATKPVYLVSLDDEHIEKLIAESPYYSKNTISKDAYGTPEDVNTVAVGAVVIANDDVSEADVYNFLYGVFENVDAITAAHAKGAELDLDFAASVTSIPYHPGAVKYFAEKGKTVTGK